MSSDSKGVKEALDKAVKEAGLEDQVEVRGVGCMKLCCQGPLVQVDSAWPKARPSRSAPRAGPALPEGHAGGCGVAHRHAQGRQDQGAAGRSEASVLHRAVVHRAGQQRHRGPGAHRVLHRGRRLPGAARRAARDDAQGSRSTRWSRAGCAGAAARVIRPASSGRRWPRRPASRNTSSATPTKATRARSWTAACWRAIRTACWKAWPSRPTRWARPRASFTCARSIRWRSAGCRRPSNRPSSTGCWAAASSNRPSTSTSICASAPARLSAARRRR